MVVDGEVAWPLESWMPYELSKVQRKKCFFLLFVFFFFLFLKIFKLCCLYFLRGIMGYDKRRLNYGPFFFFFKL